MLPGPFWSLGDVIPEQIYVTRFAGEKHIYLSISIYPITIRIMIAQCARRARRRSTGPQHACVCTPNLPTSIILKSRILVRRLAVHDCLGRGAARVGSNYIQADPYNSHTPNLPTGIIPTNIA